MRIHWPPGRNRGLGGLDNGWQRILIVEHGANMRQLNYINIKLGPKSLKQLPWPSLIYECMKENIRKSYTTWLPWISLNILASGNTCDALSHMSHGIHRMVWDTLRYSSQLVDFKVPRGVGHLSEVICRSRHGSLFEAVLHLIWTSRRVDERTFVFAKGFKSVLVTASLLVFSGPVESFAVKEEWEILNSIHISWYLNVV